MRSLIGLIAIVAGTSAACGAQTAIAYPIFLSCAVSTSSINGMPQGTYLFRIDASSWSKWNPNHRQWEGNYCVTLWQVGDAWCSLTAQGVSASAVNLRGSPLDLNLTVNFDTGTLSANFDSRDFHHSAFGTCSRAREPLAP